MTPLLTSQRFIRLFLAGGLALGLATLAGCGIGSTAGTSPSGPVAMSAISGTVHGGQQPISGATIQLWQVGSTGYGSDGTNLLGSHVVTTDPGGSFTITGDYTCPTNDTLVYLTATAGNPGLADGTNNTGIKLVAALGACGPLAANPNTFISINEVTTAAAAIGLGQYFSTTFGVAGSDNFGTANTTQAKVGLANAFATVNNLVDFSAGAAKTSITLTGTAGTITATPEASKLYTIANILAACVNSDGTGTSDCQTTLFPDVTPPASTQATDTLQAAVYMSLNPTSNNANGSAANIAALYNSQSTEAPFTGGAQPTDWTVGIQYTDSGTSLLLKPQNLAIDGNGNVWVLSQNAAAGGLAELSPTGTPLSTITSLNEYGPFTSPVANPPVLSSPKTTTTTFTTQNTVFTTTFGGATNNPLITPRNLAIDPSNNVWFTQSSGASSTTGGSNGTTTIPTSGAVYEIATSGGVPTGSTFGFSTGKSAYGLAIDGTGNVFVGEQSSSAYFDIYEFPFNATPGAGLLTPIAYPIATAVAGTPGTTGVNSYIAPENLAFDPLGNLWMTGGLAASTFTVELTNINTSSCGTLTPNSLCQVTTSPTLNTYNSYTLTSASGASGLAADTSAMFIADSGTSTVSQVPYATPASNSALGNTSTFTAPHYLAVDGAGNVWVANTNTTPLGTNPTAGGSVSEISSAGTVLSPSSATTTTVNPGYVHAGLVSGTGIAVDPSGNVWVANATSGPGSVFEIVGAATPAVTPIASALGTNAVAKKP